MDTSEISIKEQQQMENALRNSKETLHTIFENAPFGILHFNKHGIIDSCNSQFVDIIGSSCDQLIGLDMTKLSDKNVVSALKSALSGTIGKYEGLYHSVTGGKSTFVRVLFTPIINDGICNGGVGIVEDISERKQAEIEREQLKLQLIKAQKMEAMGTLAGGVAHDFNNMLMVILGYVETAMDKMDSSEPLYDDLSEIKSVANHSVNIIRHLLAFAKQQKITPRIINLNDTINSMLTILQRLINRNITLEWLPTKELCQVCMDPCQIDQILANLCVNARDSIYSSGKIVIKTDVMRFDKAVCDKTSAFTPGEYVLLSVSDNGCGMDKNTLENIFEPFFTTKEHGKGTGLGLATVYGIVQQNNGFINVYSKPGYGTTFYIYFPMDKSDSD
ncbi:MAG: PAS domain S-box protein [Desulfamplus sp.]|nr:PAS domain S-box protein [Desulfamplus sp.]